MALYESLVVLAGLLWRFKFRVEEGFVMDDVSMLTMKAVNGLHVYISSRTK